MEFEWVAIALGDVTWITLAFCLGLAARFVNLPPLVGFLITGFVLNYMGFSSGDTLQKLADLGITLLLFIVGLKLNLKVLIKPQVWSVTLLHIAFTVFLFGGGLFILSLTKVSLFASLGMEQALLIAFALSFSSTVFVVKILEEKGETKALHGRLAISILVMQDIAAVIFLASSTGKLPSYEALLLLLLVPLRPLFFYLLKKTGHGELLILYSLVLALGAAELFELVGLKGDLGALVMGVFVSTHPKASEMAKTMLGFKDLFLVGFFLSIGMTGDLTLHALLIGLCLVPFVFLKSILMFVLLAVFKLRSRTSLLTTLSLSNYSEFGLIVIAIGVSTGMLTSDWLVVMAIALSASLVMASPINRLDHIIYSSYRNFWIRFQRQMRLPDDKLVDTFGAKIAVFGMGRVGSGAYDKMRESYGDVVIGIDADYERLEQHKTCGRKVIYGDPCDADFWEKMEHDNNLQLVMFTLPKLQANLDALEQLQEKAFAGKVAVAARFPDEETILKQAGAHAVFNIYIEAGSGFADHVEENIELQ